MKQNLFRVLLILLFTGLFALFLFFPGKTVSSSMQVNVQAMESSKTDSENHRTVKIKKSPSQIEKFPLTEEPDVVEPLLEQVKESVLELKTAEEEAQNEEMKETDKMQEAPSSLTVSVEVEGSQTERIYNLNTDTSGAIEPPQIDLNSVYKKIVYPLSLKRRNVEASFEVKVYVDSTGKVSVQIPADVNPQFKNSVQTAFKNLKARPATLGGSPVSVVFTIPIRFQLN